MTRGKYEARDDLIWLCFINYVATFEQVGISEPVSDRLDLLKDKSTTIHRKE